MISKILSAFFIYMINIFAYSSERLNLTIGESITYSLPAYPYVEVSRKGIIEVYFDKEKSHWQFTALKPGFVVVSFFATSIDSDVSKKFYIEVAKTRPPEMNKNISEICANKLIDCAHNGRILTGIVDDPYVFYYIKKICQKSSNCLFALQLTPKGRQRIIEFLTQELGNNPYNFEISPTGNANLSRPCLANETLADEAKFLKNRLSTLFENSHLAIKCQNDQQSIYQLNGKVLLMSSVTAKELGFDTSLIVTNSIASKNNLDLITTLNASIQNQKITILAEPNIKLLAGQKAMLHSGNEFAISELDNTKNAQIIKTEWKKTGVKMEAIITPIDYKRVFVDFDFFLKTRQDNDVSLSSHQFTSKLIMEIGQSQIVGGAEFKQNGFDDQGLAISNLPIIGPLFRLTQESKANFQVFLWLNITKSSLIANSQTITQ